MRNKLIVAILFLFVVSVVLSFKNTNNTEVYELEYQTKMNQFAHALEQLMNEVKGANIDNELELKKIRAAIDTTRLRLKTIDFWARYLEPVAYKKINGPLPVEWETEVFEKFEKPYKREGAGLTIAALYLDESVIVKDSLISLIQSAIDASKTYRADSITQTLKQFDHFYFCNRLYLLNLATIYTTGFDNPNTETIIHELQRMLHSVAELYQAYNHSYPLTALSKEYLDLYQRTIDFVAHQAKDYTQFNHFVFIKDYVNPLFQLNQQLILKYAARTKSTMDYSLNKRATSIFDKALYEGQSGKGVYYNVLDKEVLNSIRQIGKSLFYDPILSGNNERSCASCHQPKQFFTDTATANSLQYNRQSFLARNTPSLINVDYNHLIMLDGAHISLQNQTRAVMLNPIEMGGEEKAIVDKVLSCDEYMNAFQKLLKYTPQEPEISFHHIISALTFYYTQFSKATASFDNAMNRQQMLDVEAQNGFNLFMSKAQCATCHFLPQFNGVKPPYIGSEFEVLGTPATLNYSSLSKDMGRYQVNPAKETMNAFRTGTLRNIMKTAPYMHNGVFKTIDEVIDFYDGGGGVGHGLKVPNQTLSSDSLHLTPVEKKSIVVFLHTLTESVPLDEAPKKLPKSKITILNQRKIGGTY